MSPLSRNTLKLGGLVLNALAVAAVSLSSAVARTTIQAESLDSRISVELRLDEEGGPLGLPIFEAIIQNTSEQRIAVSQTFGGESFYLYFEIIAPTGERVAYPPEDVDYFESPKYKCLRPTDRIATTIPLGAWRHIFGGKISPSSELTRFTLPPGAYKARAVYKDRAGGERRQRCRRFYGTASSAWVQFGVGSE